MTDIIRCRDCEFYKKNRYAETGWCKKAFMEIDISEDDFCSRAEMRKPETSVYVKEKTVEEASAKPKKIRCSTEELASGGLWEDFCSMPTSITNSINDSYTAAVRVSEAAYNSGVSIDALSETIRNAMNNRIWSSHEWRR